MNQINVGTVNGVAITAFHKEEQFLVAIKPICTALGIDIERQRRKIMEDEYIAPVAVLETAGGADGCPLRNALSPYFLHSRMAIFHQSEECSSGGQGEGEKLQMGML